MRRVWEIMSKGIASLESSKPASSAAKRMAELGFGCLLITKNGRMVGIVTDRDLITKVFAKDADAGKVKVEEIMSHPVITVESSADVCEASKLMLENSIKRLVVTDHGNPVGMLTTTDITRYLSEIRL